MASATSSQPSSPASPPSPSARSTSPASLLELLPPQEHERVSPLLTRVRLEMSETVIWPDDPIEHVHLPIDAVLSIISHGEDGEMVETGLVGREGTTGLPLFLGSDSVPQRVVCQVPGEGWRMRAADFRREATRPGAFQTVLLRYAQALLMLTSQGVLCNRLHGLDERLARWLLLIHDRVGRDTFSLTHEFIAVMLGVRRAGVTVAMGSLQRAGAVHYRRGEMTVTDRAALEAAACPCYPILAKQFDRLLGAPPAPAGPGA